MYFSRPLSSIQFLSCSLSSWFVIGATWTQEAIITSLQFDFMIRWRIRLSGCFLPLIASPNWKNYITYLSSLTKGLEWVSKSCDNIPHHPSLIGLSRGHWAIVGRGSSDHLRWWSSQISLSSFFFACLMLALLGASLCVRGLVNNDYER